MLCTRIYLGHASLTTIRGDFGHEFTGCKFLNPPNFVVDLPQSVLECAFNAQVRARDFDYFSTDFAALCSLCMRMIRFEYLRRMYLHGTSTFSTVGEFPCKTP